MPFELFIAGEQRRESIAQAAENSSRPAVCTITHQTTGVGYVVMPDPLRFDVVFTTEPAFTSGAAVVKAPDTRHWMYPMANAGVYKWQRDANGYYTGAYVYFTVKCDPAPAVVVDTTNLAGFYLDTVQGMTTQYLRYQSDLAKAKRGEYTALPVATLEQFMAEVAARIEALGGVVPRTTGARTAGEITSIGGTATTGSGRNATTRAQLEARLAWLQTELAESEAFYVSGSNVAGPYGGINYHRPPADVQKIVDQVKAELARLTQADEDEVNSPPAHPEGLTLTHHLVFQGPATKALADVAHLSTVGQLPTRDASVGVPAPMTETEELKAELEMARAELARLLAGGEGAIGPQYFEARIAELEALLG